MTKMISYVESRGGKFDNTVFYGLQIFLKNIPWYCTITTEDVSEAQDYLGNEKVFFGHDVLIEPNLIIS
jgi:nicotinamide phosphoribosyltransferase